MYNFSQDFDRYIHIYEFYEYCYSNDWKTWRTLQSILYFILSYFTITYNFSQNLNEYINCSQDFDIYTYISSTIILIPTTGKLGESPFSNPFFILSYFTIIYNFSQNLNEYIYIHINPPVFYFISSQRCTIVHKISTDIYTYTSSTNICYSNDWKTWRISLFESILYFILSYFTITYNFSQNLNKYIYTYKSTCILFYFLTTTYNCSQDFDRYIRVLRLFQRVENSRRSPN